MNVHAQNLANYAKFFQKKIGENNLSNYLFRVVERIKDKTLEQTRLLSINVLVGLVSTLNIRDDDTDMIDRVASLVAVPDNLLTEDQRIAYIARTIEGEDVYAYPSGEHQFWNLFDIETRIALALMPHTWVIVDEAFADFTTIDVTLKNTVSGKTIPITVIIDDNQYNYDVASKEYGQFAHRRVLSIIGHINAFDQVPDSTGSYHA